MSSLIIFAGWGSCGPLDTAGISEFYYLTTIIELLALGLSEVLLILANNRFTKPLNGKRTIKSHYIALNQAAGMIRVLVAFSALSVFGDYIIGDGNLANTYDGDIPCDPITLDVLLQAGFILSLTLFLGWRQYYRFKKSTASTGKATTSSAKKKTRGSRNKRSSKS